MKVLKELEVLEQHSSGAKKDLCKYLLEFDGDYLTLKSERIANEFHTSTALCTRIAKELGVHGFSELKFCLDLEKKKRDELKQQKSAGFERYRKELITNLDSAIAELDIRQIKKIAKQIQSASRVLVIYDSQNNLYAEMFAQIFYEDDIDIRLCNSYVYSKKQISFCQENDYIVMFKFNNKVSDFNKTIKRIEKANLHNCIIANHNLEMTNMTEYIDVATTAQFGIGRRLLITTIIDLIYNEYCKSSL